MAKKSLSEQVFGILAGRPEIKRIERSQSPCGRTKKRIKIVRAAPKLTLTITEPEHPSTSFDIETSDLPATALCVEQYARREGAQVLNK